ncbi:hypothetical protein GBA52_026834 [Prunus armeniaca]|nr:hypothetical protein GBA52_026834 [Prunus armeniaca]
MTTILHSWTNSPTPIDPSPHLPFMYFSSPKPSPPLLSSKFFFSSHSPMTTTLYSQVNPLPHRLLPSPPHYVLLPLSPARPYPSWVFFSSHSLFDHHPPPSNQSSISKSIPYPTDPSPLPPHPRTPHYFCSLSPVENHPNARSTPSPCPQDPDLFHPPALASRPIPIPPLLLDDPKLNILELDPIKFDQIPTNPLLPCLLDHNFSHLATMAAPSLLGPPELSKPTQTPLLQSQPVPDPNLRPLPATPLSTSWSQISMT